MDSGELSDGPLTRLLWRLICRLDAVIGVEAARRVAALVMQAAARTERGWAKGVFRVAAPHVAARARGLQKLPERWWSTRPVVTVRRMGLRLRLDLRDNLQRVLYFTGTYEPAVLDRIERALPAGGVFLDVGAHIGVHSLIAAKYLRRRGGGRVIAFEPAPDSAARLREAAARNRLDITVVESALGARSGHIELFGSDEYSAADTGVRSQHGVGPHIGTFPVVAFDAWSFENGLNRLDAVKIDVEGAEASVIEGMHKSLQALRPQLLVIETKHDSPGSTAVRRRLTSIGYRTRETALFGNEVWLPSGGDVPDGRRPNSST